MSLTITIGPVKAWTVEMVREAVAHIKATAGDDELAHAAEDRLHRAVLASIAAGLVATDQIRAVADAALTTCEIEFARWCA